MQNQIDNVKKKLDNQRVQYSIFSYDEGVKNAEEASSQIGISLEKMVKSLLVKVEGEYMMLLLSAVDRMDKKKVEMSLGRKFKLASAEEVKDVTGYEIGNVTPILPKNELKIYIDQKVIHMDEVGVGSGIRGYEIALKPVDLLKLTNAEVVEIV